jgi:hypothetical protein
VNAGNEPSASGDDIVIGCRRDCRNKPSIRNTPSRDLDGLNISYIMV